MANIQGSSYSTFNFSQATAAIPGGLPQFLQAQWTFSLPVTPGTAGTADNADLRHAKIYSLAAAPVVLDLTNLTDTQGATISLVRVRKILLRNDSTTAAIKMGYASTTSNAWTSLVSNPGQITLRPSTTLNDGWMEFTAPDATGYVVSSTNKLLQFDPSSASMSLEVVILGCSA